MTVLEHLEELRKVLIISVLAIAAASGICYFFFREELLQLFLNPLEDLELEFVFLRMTEAFLTKIKVSILAGIVFSSPIVLWQIWRFVVPALRPGEKKYIYILLPISIILFAVGVVFAYTTVFQFAALFLLGQAGEGLSPMLSISRYVSFVVYFMLPFGFVFQLPLVVAFLSRIGAVTTQTLKDKRKYAIIIIFAGSAVLTPPDLISQFFLAGPVIVLYEISVLVSRFIKPKKIVWDEEDEDL